MQYFLTSAGLSVVAIACVMYVITTIYARLVPVDIIERVPTESKSTMTEEPDPGWCRVDFNDGASVYGWVREVVFSDVGTIEINRESEDRTRHIEWVPVRHVRRVCATTEDNVRDRWLSPSNRPAAVTELEEAYIAKNIADSKAADDELAAKLKVVEECPATKKPSDFPPAIVDEATADNEDGSKPF